MNMIQNIPTREGVSTAVNSQKRSIKVKTKYVMIGADYSQQE